MSCKSKRVSLKVLPLPLYLRSPRFPIENNYYNFIKIEPIYNRPGFYYRRVDGDRLPSCWMERSDGTAYIVPEVKFNKLYEEMSYKILSKKEMDAIKIILDTGLIRYKKLGWDEQSALYRTYILNRNRLNMRKMRWSHHKRMREVGLCKKS